MTKFQKDLSAGEAKHVWVGVGVFIFRDGKFLMMKRAGKHAPGEWSVPGGWQEIGETPSQASAREVKEEVGCEIANIRFGLITNNYYPEESHHSVSIMTLSDWVSGEPQILEPNKCEELRWVDFDSLPSPLFRAWDDILNGEFLDNIKRELKKSKKSAQDGGL